MGMDCQYGWQINKILNLFTINQLGKKHFDALYKKTPIK
jgi:hypothetical protein